MYLIQNVYYYYFFLIPLCIDFFSSIVTFTQSGSWHVEELINHDLFSVLVHAQNCKTRNILHIFRWRSLKFWMCLIMIFAWLNPLASYLDSNGISTVGLVTTLNKHSSCTRDYGSDGIINPRGAFPFQSWTEFEIRGRYVFCTRDQEWAKPNIAHYVKGYAHVPNSAVVLNCGVEVEDGFASKGYECDNAYPDPSLGIQGPIEPYTRNSSTSLCAGNTLATECLAPSGSPTNCPAGSGAPTLPPSQLVSGRPYKICSECLNDWRRMSGIHNGPDGYEHCAPYDDLLPASLGCWFCVGRGYGWLADARYSDWYTMVEFWLSTTIVWFVPFVEMIGFYAMRKDIGKRFKVTNGQYLENYS